MANICSAHAGYDPDCPRCNTTIEEFCAQQGMDYEKMHADALAAGEHTCKGCKFVYYKTVSACPRCNKGR